jgi:acetylornithine deacetylase/succinyl-diaminopimelate desuccinylase-like protein
MTSDILPPAVTMNTEKTKTLIDQLWDAEIVPTISKYIEIPNQSPLFDPDWKKNGHMDRAVALVRSWVEKQNIPGSRLQVLEAEGRTPLLFMEVDGDSSETILLYGHLDKQPAMIGWEAGLGPWTPVLRDGKLFGRGGADDGYAVFAVISAIKALKDQNLPHARLVVLIECCEESGSVDLPYYVELCSKQIGTPSLVICLDSGCGNYDQLWTTTSLRGSIVGTLTVEVLTEGVHSGDASGIVPSSFRILRSLLDRLEDSETGVLKPEWLSVEVPKNRIEETKRTAEILGDDVHSKFPYAGSMQPVSRDAYELLMNRTWRPALAYIGQAGFPDLVQGGNVLRPKTSLKLSLRIPPTLDAADAEKNLRELFETNPPYGANVTFEAEKGGTGWQAPEVAPWLQESIDQASKDFFGTDSSTIGEGGSIPFMGMLGERFPNAQFLITGVLGPHSNAHGPNEFLHIGAAKNISSSVAKVIADHYVNGSKA